MSDRSAEPSLQERIAQLLETADFWDRADQVAERALASAAERDAAQYLASAITDGARAEDDGPALVAIEIGSGADDHYELAADSQRLVTHETLDRPELSIHGPSAINEPPRRREITTGQPASAAGASAPPRAAWLLAFAASAALLLVGFGLLQRDDRDATVLDVATMPTVSTAGSSTPTATEPPPPTPSAAPTPTTEVPNAGELIYTPILEPFECTGLHETAQVIGEVSGFEDDEQVRFTWDGRTSAPQPAVNGVRELRWDCNPSQARVVVITATGATDNRSITFEFTTIAIEPKVQKLVDPIVCSGEDGDSPVVATISGFDAEADGQPGEAVEVSWTDSQGTQTGVTLPSDSMGTVEIQWDCSAEQARIVEVTATGRTSGMTTTFALTLEQP